MDFSQYGPFALVVAIAGFLTATFSLTILKSVGRARSWTDLLEDTQPFLVTAGPRFIAVLVMAVTFVVISAQNWDKFAIAAGGFAVFGFAFVYLFDLQRRRHTIRVPIVGPDGSQAVDEGGAPRSRVVVVGTEDTMKSQARADYDAARKAKGDMSLKQFLSGYGGNSLYDPGALWDSDELARISSRLVLLLMAIFLCGVITLYIAAFVVEVNLTPDQRAEIEETTSAN